MGARAVTGTYTAHQDTFCLRIDAQVVREVAALSPPFADFLSRSILTLLEASQRLLRESQASQALADQSLESPLGELMCPRAGERGARHARERGLRLMHQQRVGSIPVVDAGGHIVGILTRYDVLGRITLPQLPLDTPIDQVMSSPVRSLGTEDSALEAALLMSQHGIRHVPVTRGGRLVGIVSERDLFAIQRLSIKQIGTAIRSARALDTLEQAGADIRRFAGILLGQGVQARQLTRLISRLNDALTVRIVESIAADRGMNLHRACWLAAGSEGREEQTISTDQDNGLLFESDEPEKDRPVWLAFAKDVNQALDACGFPLCRGNVMASNPQWCLTTEEWGARFTRWISRGAPEDLLDASIWLDFRPLAGRVELAAGLRPLTNDVVRRTPRFLRQLAANVLGHRVPLDWLGGFDTTRRKGQELLDVKLNGTMIYVDAARLYALANGIEAVNTRSRFEAVARALRVPPHEAEGWVGGFEFLQMLRLRRQIGDAGASGAAGDGGGAGSSRGGSDGSGQSGGASEPDPNLLDVASLNDIDRRILKEALRVARRLQQRMQLDFAR